MASFNKYIPKLQKVEGGYQNNPNDQGNFNSLGQNVGTQYGISAAFYESIIKRPPSVADMKAITKQKAKDLYRIYFWNANLGNQIKSQSVAETVIDHHINSGNGVIIAQKLLNNQFGKNISVDNGMGNETLNALNSVNAKDFTEAYNEKRKEWYQTRSNSDEFAAGWIKRLESFVFKHSTVFSIGMLISVAGTAYLSYKLLNQS